MNEPVICKASRRGNFLVLDICRHPNGKQCACVGRHLEDDHLRLEYSGWTGDKTDLAYDPACPTREVWEKQCMIEALRIAGEAPQPVPLKGFIGLTLADL